MFGRGFLNVEGHLADVARRLEDEADSGYMTASEVDAAIAAYMAANPVSADMKPYGATGTGSNIPAAATKQDLSTEQMANANYALASDEITVSAAGKYQISYTIRIDEDSTSGGTRGRVSAYIEADSTPITNSYSGVYVREASGGTGLASCFNVTLTAGAVLALWADQDGNGTPDISAENIQISIIKVG